MLKLTTLFYDQPALNLVCSNFLRQSAWCKPHLLHDIIVKRQEKQWKVISVSDEKKLIGSDYLLLLLYLNNKEPIKSAVRLTKMMFLFNEEIVSRLKKTGVEIDTKDLPNFQAYYFGPFSKDIYEQIELFQSIEFIKVKDLNAKEEMDEADDWEEQAFIDELDSQESYLYRRDGKLMKYELLSLGESYVKTNIVNVFTKEQLKILSDYKTRIIQTPVKAILKYVYTKYPEMMENSLIKDEVLKR
jgi:uncharacterized protein